MLKQRSRVFWLIAVPLIAAAIHLALLCLVVCTWVYCGRSVATPRWAVALFSFLAWPYGLFYRCSMLGVWIGIGLSFLWMPAVAFGAVKAFVGFGRKGAEPASAATGASPHR
jgi:hypothetical protein